MTPPERTPARLADGSPPATPDALFARLDALGIAVATWHHPPVFTVDEARRVSARAGACRSAATSGS